MTTISLTRTGTSLALGLAAVLFAVMPVAAAESALPTAGAGGCYTLQPGTAGVVDHPVDPAAIVLRMSVGGGFVPTSVAFIETPRFTLHGNNVAIFQAPVPAGAQLTDPLPPFQCFELTPDQVDELLTFALDEGGLAGAATDYPNPNIMDVPTTVFRVDAGGTSKTVSVNALGFEMAPEDQVADRAGFAALADLLGDFGATVEGEQPYDVPGYAALLEEDTGDPDPESLPWPWPDLDPTDLLIGEPSASLVLTPEQVAQVTSVPNGGQVLIPVIAPDGTHLRLSIRPLLPDDHQG